MAICDYAGYDYKKEFWEKTNRAYEDLCERRTLTTLIKKIGKKPQVIMDAGCGFGRLFDTYEPLGDSFILLDYAQHLLDQAQETIKNPQVKFVQGNLLALPLPTSSVDLVLTVRTLHHLQQPEIFFREVHRILKPEGHFIFEIPNKRHLVNILRFAFGKMTQNPFSQEPLVINGTFLNYHPETIFNLMKQEGFIAVTSLNTSFFRSALLKKLIPAKVLSQIDQVFQGLFSWSNLTPSIYVLARKK